MIAALAAALLLAAPASPSSPAAQPLVVYAAGSTVGALGAMLKRFTAKTGQPVRMVNGPAGLLLKRIESGEHVDLFVSANMAHPEQLTREGKAGPTVLFARNAVCLTARPDVHLTSSNMLDRLLDPAVKIGASTPGADPGGDYAWALFNKADQVRPGAGAILKQKAKPLVGGASPPSDVPKGVDATRYYLTNRTVDVFVGYCSSHDEHPAPGFDKVHVPRTLSFPIGYGLAAVKGSNGDVEPRAQSLVAFLTSPEAQALLPAFGFARAY
jgi:ABC-type molybdate transport system substrate-binding protein